MQVSTPYPPKVTEKHDATATTPSLCFASSVFCIDDLLFLSSESKPMAPFKKGGGGKEARQQQRCPPSLSISLMCQSLSCYTLFRFLSLRPLSSPRRRRRLSVRPALSSPSSPLFFLCFPGGIS
ncbi:hypothetical protein PIB30_036111 [Stylosanthes scabra]|uniref:Uncharacterized protein n=1 Tax=Stylosanthes scabra TaxID=79078 RepID=A0ABU6VC92_9FABA|nr:hypothetical protein [Stylosanthes scabra]